MVSSCVLRSDGESVAWTVAPVTLERTTAECMWAAFKASSVPWGAWGLLPPDDVATWVVLVFGADLARSNLRLYAQIVEKCAGLRQCVLTHFAPCRLHVLHKSVVPAMSMGGIINSMYRTAHVMRNGTYFGTLVKSCAVTLARSMLVVHNQDPEPENTNIARKLLRLVLANGLPDRDVPARVHADIECLLQV